jgi:outer membrane receptor for ferrienterochelin and colicins
MELQQKEQQIISLAGRYFMKTVGEANCNGEKYRGGSEVYGESIYTKRWELLGAYELPIAKKCCFPYTDHDQTLFMVIFLPKLQRIGFGQLTWDKKLSGHDLLLELPYVTTMTTTPLQQSKKTSIDSESICTQDEISLAENTKFFWSIRLQQ